jgi:hypothetical protein
VGFTFDATWNEEYQDFFITRIANDRQTTTEFWLGWLDYQSLQVGGCQQKVTNGQDVLWAFGVTQNMRLLKLSPLIGIARVGTPYRLTVINGATGDPIEGATVDGVRTNSAGVAEITFESPGLRKLKAEAADCLRSNIIRVLVLCL